MSDDIHQGGCACGAVRYETQGKPQKTAACHCRYCQLRTGSAFGLSVYFAADQLRQLSGELKDYSFETDSGRRFTTRFCPTCGTTVFWELELFEGTVGVSGGTFDPPAFWFEVEREIFARSKAPFVSLDVAASADTTNSYAPIQPDRPTCNGEPDSA